MPPPQPSILPPTRQHTPPFNHDFRSRRQRAPTTNWVDNVGVVFDVLDRPQERDPGAALLWMLPSSSQVNTDVFSIDDEDEPGKME